MKFFYKNRLQKPRAQIRTQSLSQIAFAQQ